MRLAKFIKFLLVLFVLSLIQAWVVLLILWYEDLPMNFGAFLSLGSLYFFSTSLVYVNSFNLLESNVPTDWDKIWGYGAIALVSALAIVGYSLEYASALSEERHVVFEGRYQTAQVICFSVAVLFSIYTGFKTKRFQGNRYASY